jgi:hypothetical protein
MKSLITRFASIGSIVSLAVGGSSAGTLTSPASPVHIHKGASVTIGNDVLAKVTAVCPGTGPPANGQVVVEINQTSMQSNNGVGADAFGNESVTCDGTPHTVAVGVFGYTYNLGDATATVTLFDSTLTQIGSEMRPIKIGFPVVETMEEEEGGNPEE